MDAKKPASPFLLSQANSLSVLPREHLSSNLHKKPEVFFKPIALTIILMVQGTRQDTLVSIVLTDKSISYVQLPNELMAASEKPRNIPGKASPSIHTHAHPPAPVCPVLAPRAPHREEKCSRSYLFKWIHWLNYITHVESSLMGTEQYDFKRHPQTKTPYTMKQSVLASMFSFRCTRAAGCHELHVIQPQECSLYQGIAKAQQMVYCISFVLGFLPLSWT